MLYPLQLLGQYADLERWIGEDIHAGSEHKVRECEGNGEEYQGVHQDTQVMWFQWDAMDEMLGLTKHKRTPIVSKLRWWVMMMGVYSMKLK